MSSSLSLVDIDIDSLPPGPDIVQDSSSTIVWALRHPISNGRRDRSIIWTYGDLYNETDGDGFRYRCRVCPGNRFIKFGQNKSTTPILRHLNTVHRIHVRSSIPSDSQSISDDTASTTGGSAIGKSMVHRSLVTRVNIQELRDAILQWVVRDHVPFVTLESTSFLNILKLLSPGIEEYIGGRQTMRRWLQDEFQLSKSKLNFLLASAISKIHLSFDLWTSPNGLAIIAIVAHFVDQKFRCQNILIGMKRLESSHTGLNIAGVIIPVISEFDLGGKLGVFVADNAEVNDVAIGQILKHFEPESILDIASRRGRCLGHIINLAAKAFLFGGDVEVFEQEAVFSLANTTQTSLQRSQDLWRKKGPVGKVHNIVVFIRSSPQRRAQFERNLAIDTEIDHLGVLCDNSTRWNSTYLSLRRALLLRPRIMMFCFENQSFLKKDTLSDDDWVHLDEICEGLRPFYEATLICEGQGQQGHHGSVWETLPTIEMLLSVLEANLQTQKNLGKPRSHLAIASQNAWQKLKKYYELTDYSYDIYATSTLLNPSLRLGYFEGHWIDKMAEFIPQMLQRIRARWEKEYRGNLVEEPPRKKQNILQEYLRRPIANGTRGGDQLDQYLKEQPVEFSDITAPDLLQWWSTSRYNQLRKLAFDTLSIPAMSSEVERVFSSAKLNLRPQRNRMTEDTLEELELLRHWWKIEEIAPSEPCQATATTTAKVTIGEDFE